MRILVCGAGVAGSVLAGALATRSGIELIVVERTAREAQLEAGTALNIGPNGMQSLASLSSALEASLRAAGFDWTRWQVGLTDGTPLLDFPLRDVAACAGLRIRWASVYERLRAPIAGRIEFGSTVAAVRYEDGVMAAGKQAGGSSGEQARAAMAGRTDVPPGTDAGARGGDRIARLSVDIEGPRGMRRIDGVDLLVAAEGRYSPLRERLCGPVAAADLLCAELAAGASGAEVPWLTAQIGDRRSARARFAQALSWRASDTLLAGSDPVRDTLRKGEPAFMRELAELFSGGPPARPAAADPERAGGAR